MQPCFGCCRPFYTQALETSSQWGTEDKKHLSLREVLQVSDVEPSNQAGENKDICHFIQG